MFLLGAGGQHLAEQPPNSDVDEALHVPATLGESLSSSGPSSLYSLLPCDVCLHAPTSNVRSCQLNGWSWW